MKYKNIILHLDYFRKIVNWEAGTEIVHEAGVYHISYAPPDCIKRLCRHAKDAGETYVMLYCEEVKTNG